MSRAPCDRCCWTDKKCDCACHERALREALPLDLVETLYAWREVMRPTVGEFVQPAPSIVTDAMQRWVRATGEKP